MKTILSSCVLAIGLILPLAGAPSLMPRLEPKSGDGSIASDLEVIRQAQEQALEQAREMLGSVETEAARSSLQAAIREMERSRDALQAATQSPEQFATALAAQQNAYQALLKAIPREYRMTRNRQNGAQGGQSGQPQRQQMEQLDMAREENRYETERQARTEPDPAQREQLRMADRLKELASRQQDLNSRLQELQTALQAARTEPEREELRRQLKRLREEQREMLSQVDQMRQEMEQSSNATPESRQQLDQTREDMQRAAGEMERESASGALAAGTRAQQRMENLREDLRRSTSSQFSEQMRDLRNQARELTGRQEEIARKLDALQNGPQRSLDTSREREELTRQMARQQEGLTNLLAGMRAVTEQSETSEPLLSQQLYDTLRRADQARTEEMIRLGAELAGRGFLPQAGEAERSIRRNLESLKEGVERAAASVLGSEEETLRFAQRELDALARELENELNALANGSTNGSGSASSRGVGTNDVARAAGSERNSGQDQKGREPSESSQVSSGRPGESAETANADIASNNSESPTPSERGVAQGGNQRDGGESGTGSNRATDQRSAGGRPTGDGEVDGDAGGARLRQMVEQWGRDGGWNNGGNPITGGGFVNWSDRLRDVERVLEPADLRNELAAARERLAAVRAEYRDSGRLPSDQILKQDIMKPLAQVRVWVEQELARRDNPRGLVPLDRDPVPDRFSELVKRYYETLGSAP